MKQDEIIEMAKQAGAKYYGTGEEGVTALMLRDEAIEAFAKLVEERTAAKERERLTDAAMKAAEKAVDVAIALEREACAKLVEDKYYVIDQDLVIADAIRARGEVS